MDLFSILFSTYGLCVLLVLLCSVFVYYRYGYKPFQYFKYQGIPGPKPTPFIGNLGLIKQFKGNVMGMVEYLMKTYGQTIGIYFATQPVICTTDVDMIKEVMVKQFDKFVNRRSDAANVKITVKGKEYIAVFSARDDEWRKRRHFISPAFSGHKMKMMEPLMKESVVRLVDKISTFTDKAESVEVMDLYSKLTMEVILSTAFGRSVDVQGGKGGEVYEAACGVFKAALGKQSTAFRMFRIVLFTVPGLTRLLKPLVKRFAFSQQLDRVTNSAVKLVEMRRREQDAVKRKDLLQLLIDAGDEGTKLSTGEIVADAVGFLLAGYETTSVAITFATYLLAKNPEVQEKLANEIHEYLDENPDKSLYDTTHELEYLDMVLSETFRLYPPAPATVRLCNSDCSIGGVDVKKGVQVFVMITAVHKDPEIYPDPERFIPERFTAEEKAKRHPCAYLPFGLGPRNCVGMRFALMEAKMALIEIVRNFKIELAPETKEPLELGDSLRPKNGLYLIFHQRS